MTRPLTLPQKTIIVGLLCLACILVRLVFFQGIYLTSDDANYSHAAYKISQGDFPLPTNHWDARIANTLSIAPFYAIWGVNEYTGAAASIVYSMLNIFLIFALSREIFPGKDTFTISAISSLLFMIIPISVGVGSGFQTIHGQIFFMYGAVYWLLRERKFQPSCAYALLSGVCIGIAYLFHETGVFAFFLVAAHLLFKRTWDKRTVKRTLLIVAGFLLIFFCESLVYYAKTGNPFYRATVVLRSHFNLEDSEGISAITETQSSKLKPVENPLSGTLLGDSWFLEPFVQLLFNPSYSIIYPLFFLSSAIFLFRKDQSVLYLSALFWLLFLYYSYGSQSPFSYTPLRRLPRYILPCLLPACIIAGYAIQQIPRKSYRAFVLSLFVAISVLCNAVKGGDVGQQFHQSKFFYQFMQENRGEHFVTDTISAIGLEFLATYQPLEHVEIVSFHQYLSQIQEKEFFHRHAGDYVFLTNPEVYARSSVVLNEGEYALIVEHPRKPRKICYVPGVRHVLRNSLCDLSNGGKIYRVR